ncbi:MAG: aminotransferase class I/II-fold pyridoxal phosphate-dependent enzyme [Lachnoclostridium sp.]
MRTKKNIGVEYTFDQVVVSNGAKQALFNALQAVCNPGDEVLLFAPYWVSYPELIKMAGAKPVFVPTVEEEGFAVDFTALENAVTEHTKAIILNSASNPSGAVLSEKEVRTIAALAIKKDLSLFPMRSMTRWSTTVQSIFLLRAFRRQGIG